MEWVSVLSRSGLTLLLLSCAIAGFVVIAGIAAMAAIWHPDPRRRSSAYKVLELLLGTLRHAERRQPGGKG